MKPLPTLAAALLLIAVILVPGPVRGEGRTVVPAGSVNAIGPAIVSAGAGGVVFLDGGSHVLTDTVVVNTDGVEIVGRPGAMILGRGAAADGRLVLFRVSADGFLLAGVGVEPDPAHLGDLAVVEVAGGANVIVAECDAAGVTQLVDGGASPGLGVYGNRIDAVAVVQAAAPAAHAVVVRSAGAGEVLVEKNVLHGVRGAGSVGIEILPPLGAVHYVAKNRIDGFEEGIAGEGEGRAILVRNRVSRCENGIDLAQETTAVGWEVVRNSVDDVLAVGLFLGEGDGCVISGNDVRRAGTDGINVGGVFLTVRRNHSRFNGGYGIFGETASSDYLFNKAKRCGSGIRVEGTGNRLKRNRASKNLGDGVVSTGGNVNAEGNRGQKNGGTQVSIK